MNISFNGINFSGCGNVTIVDGCVVSSGKTFGNSQKFDEKKSLRANGINRITIKSDSTDIILTASDTNTITAHFCGEAITSAKPMLNINKNGQELFVELTIDGSLIASQLTLSISIPKRTFNVVNVISYNGDIKAKNGISAKKARLNTYKGSIESEGIFSEICATTHNGDIVLYSNAKGDVGIDANSHNGNVTVELQNIATNNIIASTKNGSTRNCFRGVTSGYTVYGQATSHNGNITMM